MENFEIVSGNTIKNIKNIPELYSQENEEDPIVHKRFFNNKGHQWFATEFDGEDVFFGLCIISESELGYFSLNEFVGANQHFNNMRNLNGLLSIIHFDNDFQPLRLSEVKRRLSI
jgi:hypothetical protein